MNDAYVPMPAVPKNPGHPAVANREFLLYQAQKEKKRRRAREFLQDYIEYCMPDPDHYEDALQTRYDCWPHHQLMIEMFTRISNKELLRAGCSIPPQHGKTTIFGGYGLTWHCGRNPEDKVIYGTYAEPRAGIVGTAVLNIFESARHKEVFPEFNLRPGEQSKSLIGFGREGSIMFVGVGSGASGNPCDLFIIDDPYKSRGAARSGQVRAIVWDWYCSVVEARCPVQTPVMIIHTRWTDDDLLGRLCDPEHPDYNAEDNDEFEYINIPAIVHDKRLAAILGMEPGGALWPGRPGNEKWPLELLLRIQRKNPASFSAVFMGQPIPKEGDYFKTHMIKSYRRRDLPANLRKYGASDHAVSTAKKADKSVMGVGGLDEDGNLWILPDLIWDKIETPQQVEEMLKLIKRHTPLSWWAEGDHIKKSIGPFLKLRMRAESLYSTIMCELPKVGDKQMKAQSIRGMADMGMLYLPVDAPWYAEAVKQMLRFDGSEGRADDFVDFLANLGRGIDKLMPAGPMAKPKSKDPVTGSIGWVKMASRIQKRAAARAKATAGW